SNPLSSTNPLISSDFYRDAGSFGTFDGDRRQVENARIINGKIDSDDGVGFKILGLCNECVERLLAGSIVAGAIVPVPA
ncbi:MAG: hypothetical protein KDJ29_03005, partial [Hyphomicrobiales bacterium]|nr:hypothetical protein [Hyphomicrobiales bacterium]